MVQTTSRKDKIMNQEYPKKQEVHFGTLKTSDLKSIADRFQEILQARIHGETMDSEELRRIATVLTKWVEAIESTAEALEKAGGK